MKKLLLIVLSVLFIISAASCGQAAAPATSAPSTAAPSVSASASASESQTPSPSPSASADDSWDKIQAKGSFTLGFDQTFAPMGFKDDDGEYTGFDIDLANEVGTRLGLTVNFQPIDWDSKELELTNGNIDVIWNGLTITPDREKKMLFSKPYMNNRQIIVVLAKSGIKSIADLAGKTVSAQTDSSALAAIDAKPEIKSTFKELIKCTDYVEALMELKQGTVDAVVVDETMGRYYISKDKDQSVYSVLDDNFGEEQYGVGFRLKDQAFRDKIQTTLDEMIEDGTAAMISEKWFAGDVIVK